jgi:LmbE family N-acetylglucosaminyl deacetylase
MARILAIHAHPDDVEFVAGGALALLAQAGHSITIVTMTAGDCGSAELDCEAIAAIRRREAHDSAALIGAQYLCAGFRDLAIFNDDPSRRRVVEILRRTRPDAILAAAPVDYMADHETASALVRDACFAAPARLYSTGHDDPAPALPGIPHLYFASPLDGEDMLTPPLAPGFCVDVSATFAVKSAMLATHASQREWLLKQHGMDDYLENMERKCAAAGARWGFAYGEEFTQFRGHPYPRTPMLQELLGPAVRLCSPGGRP